MRGTFLYFIAFAVLLTFSGCMKELVVRDEDKKDIYMELSLCLDELGPPTKSSSDREDAIEEIDVLVFEKNADGEFLFGYIPQTVACSDGMLRLKMKNEDADIRLAILVNMDLEQIDGELYQGGRKVVGEGDDVETAFDDIIFECSEQTVSSSWTDTAIPMFWMMDSPVHVYPGMDFFYGSIWLLRAVSKIDLYNVAENFVLTRAYVYNCLKQGMAVPYLDNIYTYFLDGKNGPVADNPSLPSTVERHGLTLIEASAQTVESGQRITDAIYLPESTAPTSKDKYGNIYPCHPDATCLVIGGKYDGSDRITYYRVDITDGSASSITSTDYGDIVRNGRYDITITEVKSEGSATPESSLGNRASIGGIIKPWENGPDAGMTVE